MTVLERIKALCREKKNIGITTLEQILGYSNGSLAKAKDIPSSRIAEIANFLEVSTDFILLGKENSVPNYSSEMAMLVGKVRNDKELSKALLKYFDLPQDKKEYWINTINMLSKV